MGIADVRARCCQAAKECVRMRRRQRGWEEVVRVTMKREEGGGGGGVGGMSRC